MKPLILILLASVCAHAQTIADAARKERARQAQVQSMKVVTTADVKSDPSSPPSDARPVENSAPGNPPRTEQPSEPEEVKPVEPPAADPTQKWIEQTTKLRTKI